jgi:hypothetical protein
MSELRESLITELLICAHNLERYPFESATMAEAGRLAGQHLREAAASDRPRHLRAGNPLIRYGEGGVGVTCAS